MGSVRCQVNHLICEYDVRMCRPRYKCENHQLADGTENDGNADNI